jgi:putative methionine-R-sulfoxide reductase with GAF domain
MNTLLSRITRYFTAIQYPYTDSLDRQQAQTIFALSRFLLLIGTASFLVYPFDPGEILSYSLVIILLGSPLSIALMQQGRLIASKTVLISAVSTGVLLFIAPFGINQLPIAALTLPLVLTGALFGIRGVMIVWVICFLGVIAIYYGEVSQFLLIEEYIDQTEVSLLPVMSIGAIMLSVIWTQFILTRRFQLISKQNETNVRALNTINTFSQIIFERGDSEQILKRSADTVRDQFGYFYVQIFIYEPTTRILTRESVTQLGRSLMGNRKIDLNTPNNVIAQTAREQRAFQVLITDPPEKRGEFLPASRIEIALPIQQGNELLGVLDIHHTSREISAYDLNILETIAAQLALAIQNRQRTEDIRILNDERSRLLDQTSRLVRDLDRVTQDRTQRGWSSFLSGPRSGGISFEYDENGRIQPISSATFPAQLRENALPEVYDEGAEQVLNIPIWVRGQPLGFMEFRTPTERPWDNRSLELARIISQRLALSLENIRLFEQAQSSAIRERIINRVVSQLQGHSDLDSLLSIAAQQFSSATGAIRTRVQLLTDSEDIPQ